MINTQFIVHFTCRYNNVFDEKTAIYDPSDLQPSDISQNTIHKM